MTEASKVPVIMCTLTARQIMGDGKLVSDMYEAGMRAVRINTAHLEGVEQLQVMTTRLKSLFNDLLILIDTKGPEMRTTSTVDDKPILLSQEMEIVLEGDSQDKPTSQQIIYVNYPDIHAEVRAGDTILIDDGRIVLRVNRVDGHRIHTAVVTGGELGPKKGLAVAGIDVNLPAVSQHDRQYISYAANSEYIDVIAHSFVRSAADVIAVKEAMKPGSKPVIAKIENQQGLDNLESILHQAEGVLIARGDLTASIGKQAIPLAQARIAKEARALSMPIYLATNILPSMMASAVASDADIEGINTAIEQGIDTMLLTNETATGAYPVETVSTLHKCLLSA